MKKTLLISVLFLCSCFGGLSRTEVVKHPDSSMQLLEIKNSFWGVPQARVGVYSREKNKIVEYGWIDLSLLKGWTVTKYDWEKKIRERGK